MSSVHKHRKVKRATLLIKRTQRIRSHPKKKTYKSQYETLKNNNMSLAKALSKEKQECQGLFAQNVQLIADIHNLSVACSNRDHVILSVEKNAKEILALLVAMSNYVTSTIASCQEFKTRRESNSFASTSLGRKESIRRMSTKSPAKGVVKPMVSGHLITKPTINLSRVNMQRVHTAPNLSSIEEGSNSPDRAQRVVEARSPIAISNRQSNYENRQRCRLPEKLDINSLRSDDEEERRLSRSNRHSGKLSRKHSKRNSMRLSGSYMTRRSGDAVFDNIGSPRVTLNDVSKLLHNSQTVNIKKLFESSRSSENHITEESNETVHEQVATEMLPSTEDLSDSESRTPKNSEDEYSPPSGKNNKNKRNNVIDEDDPLEGPSWLFSNSETDLSDSDTVIQQRTLPFKNNLLDSPTSEVQSDDMVCSLTPQRSLCQLKSVNNIQVRKGQQATVSQDDQSPVNSRNSEHNGSLCQSPVDAPDVLQEECDPHEMTTFKLPQYGNFVTDRRTIEVDDMDDFTLMYHVRGPPKEPFDIAELKLPQIEIPTAPSFAPEELETEATSTMVRLTHNFHSTNFPNDSIENPQLDLTAVNLPQLSDTVRFTNYVSNEKPKESLSESKKRKLSRAALNEQNKDPDYVPASRDKKKTGRKKKIKDDKDPSTVKVVLQKLDESEVKRETTSTHSNLPESMYLEGRSTYSAQLDNSSDSDGSSTSSRRSRPRRQKAPMNLQEPSLQKKLRRNN